MGVGELVPPPQPGPASKAAAGGASLRVHPRSAPSRVGTHRRRAIDANPPSYFEAASSALPGIAAMAKALALAAHTLHVSRGARCGAIKDTRLAAASARDQPEDE